ncbi:hypothetical protein LTR62_006954 [Meristemomyces frigidus]|uniref:TM7S3/TM198-like domain-containing protein n=1 Tax=Meristemomyces frigidus TaxID=1508187 RepID=A0AAN7YE46_9PEZI|nr:hypothetical protein LTR62_006954 [Meristemomyces frigidus]
MKLSWALPSVLVAYCCAEVVAAHNGLARRQASTDSTATSNSSSGPTSTTTDNSSAGTTNAATSIQTASSDNTASPTGSNAPQSTASGASLSSILTSSVSTSSIPSATPTTPGSSNGTFQTDKLPIHPVVTPGLGITGVILLGTGIALALVGIKHKWLHVFLSTALLTGLAVTVLIVYLMNPPVPNAIQGAYVVAAVMTGIVFGSLALVFKEIAESLGCLLGGFCLAMWFLTLAPGGLVSSTSGRAIMIGVFCVAFLALYFSHYTRMYGLIASTAFAGAQIAIIGIDCFSGAGLKEFWLYTWNLNNNIFPLNTTTYPITRGIRVELACTIIIFIFGMMSQFKIWKIVKEQRAKKDAARLQAEEQRAQEEAEVGRDVETSNNRDLKEWEAVYGNKNASTVHADSGVGSSISSVPRKESTVVSERQLDEIEMDSIPRSTSKRTAKQSGVPDVVVEDTSSTEMNNADPPPSESVENLLDQRPDGVRDGEGQHDSAISENASPTSSARQSLEHRHTVEEGPAIVPLPFSIPGAQAEDAAGDDERSVGTTRTAQQPIREKDRTAPLTQLTLDLLRGDDDEDDRASSIAAIDDGASQKRFSTAHSAYTRDFDEDPSLLAVSRERSPNPRRSVIEVPVYEEDEEAVARPPTAMDEPLPLPQAPSRQRRRGSIELSRGDTPTAQRGHQAGPDSGSASGNLTDHLPGKLSKIAMTYRTNEWAKHIADADQPDEGDDFDTGKSSPGIKVDHAFAAEAARPVDVEALSPAPLVPLKNRDSYQVSPSKNPYRESMQQAPKPLARTTSGAATPVYAHRSDSSMSVNRESSGNSKGMMRSSSGLSLNRQSSSNSISARPKASNPGLRNSSAPFSSEPLIESPIEEDNLDTAEPGRSRVLHSAMSMASMSNLMGERQSRLKRKTTSTNFNALSMQLNEGGIGVHDHNGFPEPQIADATPLSERKQYLTTDEDMTLAERRALLNQHRDTLSSPTSPTSRQQPTWPSAPTPNHENTTTTTNQNIIYDSHQPKRSNTVDTIRQNQILTQWRQSIQQQSTNHTTHNSQFQSQIPAVVSDAARQAMLQERHMAEFELQNRQAERARRESKVDIAMRTGQLHGAHRDALRRMQAKANERTG